MRELKKNAQDDSHIRPTPAPTAYCSLSTSARRASRGFTASRSSVKRMLESGSSQAFGREFPEIDKLLSKQKNLPIEEWPDEPRKWLEAGLLDQITGFVARAKADR